MKPRRLWFPILEAARIEGVCGHAPTPCDVVVGLFARSLKSPPLTRQRLRSW